MAAVHTFNQVVGQTDGERVIFFIVQTKGLELTLNLLFVYIGISLGKSRGAI